MEQENHILDGYHEQGYNIRQNSQRMPLATVGERGVDGMHPNEAIINPAFTYDEEYIINGK